MTLHLHDLYKRAGMKLCGTDIYDGNRNTRAPGQPKQDPPLPSHPDPGERVSPTRPRGWLAEEGNLPEPWHRQPVPEPVGHSLQQRGQAQELQQSTSQESTPRGQPDSGEWVSPTLPREGKAEEEMAPETTYQPPTKPSQPPMYPPRHQAQPPTEAEGHEMEQGEATQEAAKKVESTPPEFSKKVGVGFFCRGSGCEC